MNNMEDNIMINNMEDNICCRFNVGVDCDDYKCDNCGWNPEVANERIKNIRAKRQEELEKIK